MGSRNEGDRSWKSRRLCVGGGVSDGNNVMIPTDRISNLPESIIVHILSFLPTKSAVSTSFLSKAWKYHWTKVTSFDFDDRWWRGKNKGSSQRPRSGGMNFLDFINLVLFNHSAQVSINRFSLRVDDTKFPLVYINIWVNIFIARNIGVLDLNMAPINGRNRPKECHTNGFHLPLALYTCGTLEVLKLCGNFLIKVPQVVCLPKLTLLELQCVKYESDSSFGKLISCSPLLESLKIYRIHNDGMVVCAISSPALKRLCYDHDLCSDCKIDGAPRFKLEIDTPALEHVVLYDGVSTEIIAVQVLASLNEAVLDISPSEFTLVSVQAFDPVKILTLSARIMRALRKTSSNLLANFGSLTKLSVKFGSCNLRCLMDVIDCCAVLKLLHIEMLRCCDSIHNRWRDPARVPGCLLSSLTEVSYCGFKDHDDEKAMLQYIVKHASVMQRVYVSRDTFHHHKVKFDSLEKKLKLTRASPACEIFLF